MFYDKFKSLCEGKNVSCNRAALEMGLSNATPTKWKKTGATPDSTTLAKIAEYFGVSIDYLLGTEEEKPATETGDGLSEEERKFIEWFRNQASEKDKALVRMIVEGDK